MATKTTPKKTERLLFEEKKRQELVKIEARMEYLKEKWGFEDFDEEN